MPCCAPAGEAGPAAPPPPLGPPTGPVDRTSSGGLSSLSPDEAIHLLQSQVRAVARLHCGADLGAAEPPGACAGCRFRQLLAPPRAALHYFNSAAVLSDCFLMVPRYSHLFISRFASAPTPRPPCKQNKALRERLHASQAAAEENARLKADIAQLCQQMVSCAGCGGRDGAAGARISRQ